MSDNILVPENDTNEEYELREFLTNLLSLPSFIVKPIENILNNLPEKQMNYNLLPFPNSIGKKENFDLIYSKENVILFEDAVKINEKRKEKKLKLGREKAKAKRELQKAENFR